MNTLQGTFKEFCESKVTLYFTHRDVDAKVNANHLVYENQRTGLKKSVELNRIRRIVFVGIPGFTGDAIYHLCRRTKGLMLFSLLIYFTVLLNMSSLICVCPKILSASIPYPGSKLHNVKFVLWTSIPI